MNTLTKPTKPILAYLFAASVLSLLTGCNTTSEPAAISPPPAKASPEAMPKMDGMSGMSGMSMTMGTTGMDALKNLKGKEFDIAYLSQMIAHHQAAVVMANQALKTAKKPETKQNAQKVIEAQTKEISQMTSWLKEWYKTAPDTQQQALVQGDMKAMMSMPVTSDAMFFEMMIPHHQGAIDMSQLAKTRSERSEVKQLAEQIIAAQTKEIADYHKMMGHGG